MNNFSKSINPQLRNGVAILQVGVIVLGSTIFERYFFLTHPVAYINDVKIQHSNNNDKPVRVAVIFSSEYRKQNTEEEYDHTKANYHEDWVRKRKMELIWLA